MITYLSGASGAYLEKAAAERDDLGILVTPDTGYQQRLPAFQVWAADNACFNQGEKFELGRYLSWLDSNELRSQQDRCLFAPAPDVVADPDATWERSSPVFERIRELGYKAALCAQNGFDPFTTDWDRFDVLFLGGVKDEYGLEWKLSRGAEVAATFAKERGKLVHMGRVNSLKRIRIAESFGCDSADGTYMKFAPDKNLPRVLKWLETVNGGADGQARAA